VFSENLNGEGDGCGFLSGYFFDPNVKSCFIFFNANLLLKT